MQSPIRCAHVRSRDYRQRRRRQRWDLGRADDGRQPKVIARFPWWFYATAGPLGKAQSVARVRLTRQSVFGEGVPRRRDRAAPWIVCPGVSLRPV
jgi:hypothetical protein